MDIIEFKPKKPTSHDMDAFPHRHPSDRRCGLCEGSPGMDALSQLVAGCSTPDPKDVEIAALRDKVAELERRLQIESEDRQS